MTTGAILLAAGFSRRFGSIKLNAVLSDGCTVFQHTSRLLSATVNEWVVVTRPALLDAGVLQRSGISQSQVVLCHDADMGMGHSLACGIRALPDHWDACLVCLADMPFIKSATLQQLQAMATPHRIIIPVFNQHRGHPICFGRDFFAELAHSQGDTGGRELIKRHADKVELVAVNDAGILQDIDTPEDLTAC
ncbi:MAG: CTP--molybdopterin cytidylyltransferase [Gammaproteobacteria bacterium]|nr:CTP--molybdopterin cytidylyltransferase [Gammaproteobacteria bacterium]|tara:strand:- start:181 stop:756 length:576 start_codon:yes stop_codon:yes gene_type:complete